MRTFRWALAVAALSLASVGHAQTTVVGSAQTVTWNCTSSPCPWGSSDTGRALVWPASMGATSIRLGYTTTQPVYLPQSATSGLRIKLTSGSATFYAGTPDASSHRALNTISTGETWAVAGVQTGEVLSVQSGAAFNYEINPAVTPPPPPPSGTWTGSAQSVTWTCVSPGNCPWGDSATGIAAVWPSGTGATSSRLGYAVSAPIYLPASIANTRTVKITGGTGTLYAGKPNDPSHRGLITLTVGESYAVSGLASDEVLSVQGTIPFQYDVSQTPAAPPPPPPPPPTDHNSQLVTWTCGGTQCPWGNTTTGHAVVWPATAGATSKRLDYTVSAAIYLTAAHANGTTVKVKTGSATLYAGEPGGPSHRAIVTLSAGDTTFKVSGVEAGEVLSVQSSSAFTFDITVGSGSPPPTGDAPGVGHNGFNNSTAAFWRCDVPTCWSADWVGAVIHWPSNTAYANNNRHADESRTVWNAAGQKLYPYSGRWIEGCRVSAVSGVVLIIEWERGTDTWRQTELHAGQSHTIHLVGTENSALIETSETSPFSVNLSNCNPQPLP